MKKILYCIALVAVVSCNKYSSSSEYFGSVGVGYDSRGPLNRYMIGIVDDIVGSSLTALETALNTEDGSVVMKYFYQTNDIHLSQDGSVWTVKRETIMQGAVLSKVPGEQAWNIVYSGDFPFNGVLYPTSFSIKATSADASAEGHRSWKVSFTGNRTEDNGYYCEFRNEESAINYTVLEYSSYWAAQGYVLMDVYKNGIVIDRVLMEVNGGSGDTSIVHIMP